MSKLSCLGKVLNGAAIPKTFGQYPAYGGNGVISHVNECNHPEKTIIIGRVGANCGAVHISDKKCWITDNALAFRVNNATDTYFAYYLLKMLDLNRFHIGSSQPLITQTIINNIEYNYITDKKVQEKISTCIKSLDDKIANNNTINKELEAMAKTIYDYWFMQFEFPDENGKPYKSSGGKMVYNEELKREIPEGWEVDKFDNLVAPAPKLNAIKAPDYQDSGKYPIVDQAADLVTGYTDDESYLFSNEDGCVVFGDVTTYFKYINFPFAKGTDGTKIIRSKENRIPPLLLYHLIKDCKLPNVGFARHYMFLREIKVLVPCEDLCRKYDSITRPTMELRSKNIKENQELASLRDFLLPLLMNGQVGFKN